MIGTEDVQNLLARGGTVVGNGDAKIGKIGQVFLDDDTSEPEWVTVKTGLFGGALSFIPLQNARVVGDVIRVPFGKDKIKNAPRVDDDEGHLSQQEEAELYSYYEMSYSESSSDSGLPNGGVAHDSDDVDDDDIVGDVDRGMNPSVNPGISGVVPSHRSEPDVDDAMTRSEERLHVATAKVDAGKVRLRKFVTTEQVSQTVLVSHEEARIEREPITDANRASAMDGPDITEAEHEVVLHADRVVVDKDVVPMERVRLGTETVTEDQTVTEEVRKEQIETDGDVSNSAPRDR